MGSTPRAQSSPATAVPAGATAEGLGNRFGLGRRAGGKDVSSWRTLAGCLGFADGIWPQLQPELGIVPRPVLSPPWAPSCFLFSEPPSEQVSLCLCWLQGT